MATVDECRQALSRLVANLSANAAKSRERLDFDRSIAYQVTDLGVGFHGRLADGQLVGLTDGDDPKAKVRLVSSSDDLLALVDGRLNVASAWASGRVKIHAGMLDLIKLRKLL